jgi:hypothetical protein
LQQVLDGIVDQQLSGRLVRVHTAVASAIEQLATINLLSLEPADDAEADLSHWERMAPAVRETVAQVSVVCSVIEEEFPEHTTRSGVFSAETSDDRAEAESALVFRAVAQHLKKDVASVGSLLRRPELVASPWALLGELHRLREACRQRMGDAVYLSAASTGVVRREDVVPGALKDVQRALLYRTSVADLNRSVAARLEYGKADGLKTAQALLTDFELFTSMPGWRHVRAESKRQMVVVKRELKNAIAKGPLATSLLAALVEPVMTSLSHVAARLSLVMLAGHDRMVWAELTMKLEQVLLHMQLDTGGASLPLSSAATAAEKLRGRDEKFDGFLRVLRKDPVDELPPQRVAAIFEAFREQLRAFDVGEVKA